MHELGILALRWMTLPIVWYLLGLGIGICGMYMVVVRPLLHELEKWTKWANGHLKWLGDLINPVCCEMCKEPLTDTELRAPRCVGARGVDVCHGCWMTEVAEGSGWSRPYGGHGAHGSQANPRDFRDSRDLRESSNPSWDEMQWEDRV